MYFHPTFEARVAEHRCTPSPMMNYPRFEFNVRADRPRAWGLISILKAVNQQSLFVHAISVHPCIVDGNVHYMLHYKFFLTTSRN